MWRRVGKVGWMRIRDIEQDRRLLAEREGTPSHWFILVEERLTFRKTQCENIDLYVFNADATVCLFNGALNFASWSETNSRVQFVRLVSLGHAAQLRRLAINPTVLILGPRNGENAPC